jgi:hypothetical protein
LIPPEEPAGENATPFAPAKHRRPWIPAEAAEKAAFFNELARQLTPSAAFFLFSLLCGLALAAALLADSLPLVLLAAVLAPWLSSLLGIGFGLSAGFFPFVLQSLGGFLLSSALVFGGGALAGWLRLTGVGLAPQRLAGLLNPTWADGVLLLGATLVAALWVVRPLEKAGPAASVALAYELYLPLGIAGFALLFPEIGAWQTALGVFAVRLFAAVLVSGLVFFLSGVRPYARWRYVPSALVALALAGGLALGTGRPSWGLDAPFASLPTSAPPPLAQETPRPSLTPTPLPSLSPTPSPSPTPAATATPAPSITPRFVPTPTPTTVWARVNTPQGIVVRASPSFEAPITQTLANGTLVQIVGGPLPNEQALWIQIRLSNGSTGWTISTLLQTATPAP